MERLPAAASNAGRTHDGDDRESLPCSFCDRRFTTARGVRQHVRMGHPNEVIPTAVVGRAAGGATPNGGNSPRRRAAQQEVVARENILADTPEAVARPHILADTPDSGLRTNILRPVFSCANCERTFNSLRGTQQHRRRAHPNEYHAEAEARAQLRRPGNWITEEKRTLADAEASLIVSGEFDATRVNQQLHGIVAGRSFAAVKERRRREDHKTLVGALVVEKRGQGGIVSPAGERPRPDGAMGAQEDPPIPQDQVHEVQQRLLSFAQDLRGVGVAEQGSSCFGSSILDRGIDELCRRRDIPSDQIRRLAIEVVEEHATYLMAGGDALGVRRAASPLPGMRTQRAARPNNLPPETVSTSSKALRKVRYKKCQYLYHSNIKSAADHVLSGNWAVGTQEVSGDLLLPFWRSLFENNPHHDDRPIVQNDLSRWNLVEPITINEISKARRSTSKSAPGPDKLDLNCLKSIPEAILAKVYNLWLIAEHLPMAYRKSRTTLIPKVPNPVHPKEYRPISVSSHLVRLFNKILAQRLSRSIPISQRQKAFRPVDGCQENLSILDAVLHQAHSLKSEVYLGFLDLAKAFDSVSHDTVRRVLVDRGVPSSLVGYIMSTYKDSTTMLTVQGKELGNVELNKGVKQGDPLSPCLFNLILDEVIRSVRARPCGVPIGEETASILAFADDLVLIASTPEGLQNNVDLSLGILRSGGLQANPGKCRAFSLGLDRHAKKWFVSRKTFLVDGQEVSAAGPEESYKYLGILVGADGKRCSYGSILEDGLREIRRAPLKPQQRLFILCNHLIPKLIHRLVLGKVYRTQLERMDTAVRVAAKSWLRIPSDCPDALLYARTQDGGLGIPVLSNLTVLLRQRRMDKLLAVEDPLVRSAVVSGSFFMDQRYWSRPASVRGVQCRTKDECHTCWRESLGRSADGKGIYSQARAVPKLHTWLSRGGRFLSGSDFIRAVGVRCATLNTPLRGSRGRPANSGLCTMCAVPASLGHISQTCPKTHGVRCARHNNLLGFLEGKLLQKGYKVLVEPRVPLGSTYRKPDLVVWKEENNASADIIDVQVVADTFPLSRAHDRKVEKYDIPQIIRGVSTLTGCPSVAVSSATVSWRGCWAAESAETLRRLGISMANLQIMAVKALTWTASINRAWHRTGAS